MNTLTKKQIQFPVEEITKILKAYNTIGDFLETFVDRKILYKEEFLTGLDCALNEVANKKTKKVNNFNDFIS